MTMHTLIAKATCWALTLSARYTNKAGCLCASNNGNVPAALTGQGLVTGLSDTSGNSVFLGIPYAATTAGENRWKAPQSPALFKDTFKAEEYGQTCAQASPKPEWSEQGEDCLNLNIWAPKEGKNLPVFVYIYGGAMVTGSSSNSQHQGNNFAKKGIIMVSFNHRESLFASPNTAELVDSVQNFGILDVEKAMDWIFDNIRAFGGDPNRVVLGGHSSGGVQVDHYLWNHPSTQLVGAIEMSANSASGPAITPPNVGLDLIAAELGCPTGSGQLDCLRTKSISEIENTTDFTSTTNTWFSPIVDGKTRYSVADYMQRFKAGKYPSNVPLITGNSNGEGTIFGLVYGFENTDFSSWISTFDADSAHIPSSALLSAYNISDFHSPSPIFSDTSFMSGTQYGDARFNCPVDYFIDLRTSAQKTWEYRWFGAYDNVVGVPGTAPTHGTEVPFFLGGNECFSGLQGVSDEEQKLADWTNDWVVRWVKNPRAGPGWKQVDANPRPDGGVVMKLGVSGRETEFVEGKRENFNGVCQSVYKEYLPLYPVVQNPVTLASS